MKNKWLTAGLFGGALAALCCALPIVAVLAASGGLSVLFLSGIGSHWPVLLTVLLSIVAVGGVIWMMRKSKTGCTQSGCCKTPSEADKPC